MKRHGCPVTRALHNAILAFHVAAAWRAWLYYRRNPQG